MSIRSILLIYFALIIGQTAILISSTMLDPAMQATLTEIFSESLKYSLGALLGTLGAAIVKVDEK